MRCKFRVGLLLVVINTIIIASTISPSLLQFISQQKSYEYENEKVENMINDEKNRNNNGSLFSVHSFNYDEISLMSPDKFYNFSRIDDRIFKIKPVTNPRYWRMSVYSTFDGSKWHIDYEDSTRASFYNNEETYSVEGKFDGFLPIASNTVKFVCKNAYALGENYKSKGITEKYYFTSLIYDISDLNYDSFEFSEKYTQVPMLKEDVKRIAKECVKGEEKTLDKIKSIVEYLEKNYVFSAKCKTSSLESFLLKEKMGYSLHFATAFVIIARLNNIPARLAVGYSPGIIYENYRYILEGHRHAWAEVLFRDHGWISVECTPPNSKIDDGIGLSCAGIDVNVINFFRDYSINWWFMDIPEYAGGDGGGTCRGGYFPLTTSPIKENDTDGDGISDDEEMRIGSNPYNKDTDMNGVDDLEELNNGMKPYLDDEDGDGLSDYEELKIYGTNPKDPDTDGGGNCDGQEVLQNRDPLDPSDDWEFRDYDSDGIPDRIEIENGMNPKSSDSDRDCLPDDVEIDNKSDPLSPDTDGDGIEDGEEILILKTNPTVPMSEEKKIVEKIEKKNIGSERSVLAFLFICIMVLIISISALATRDYMLRRKDVGHMLKDAVKRIEKIDILKDEDKIRMEVFRIYKEFCRILEEKGCVRDEAWTLIEFEKNITEKMRIHHKMLHQFTSLIEEAVYSNHVLDDDYKRRVIECFEEISNFFLKNEQ